MLPLRVRRTRAGAPRSPRLGELAPTEPLPSRHPGPGQLSLFTATGSGENRRVTPNPRALPPDSLPHALPRDQLGLPITTRREPDRVGRRSLAEDLAERQPGLPPPIRQPGLLTPDGRISRNAKPPAKVPNALIAPETGMLPIHLRPAPARPARRTLANETATPTPPARQTGPSLITPSGQINRTARATRRRPPDAFTGNRPLASGQYPLPLGLRRQPKPTPPTADPTTPPSKATPARRAGVQLPLPLDLPKRPRRGPAPKKK
jgi:hypothetical protein